MNKPPVEPIMIPTSREKRPQLSAAEKAKLTRAIIALEGHLNDDPAHPRSGIAGIFPSWLQDLFAIAGPQLLAFLEGLAGVTPAPAPAPAPAPPPPAVTPHESAGAVPPKPVPIVPPTA